MTSYLGVILALLVLPTPATGATTEAAYIEKNAIRLSKTSVPDSLVFDLLKNQGLLVGELHGTKEMPAAIFSILQRMTAKHSMSLGVEFPLDIQRDVRHFMETEDTKPLLSTRFFRDPNYHS